MKAKYIVLLLLCISTTVAAQNHNNKGETINYNNHHYCPLKIFSISKSDNL